MKLILVRHGETEENRKGILQGHMDNQLTEKGIEQAKTLAESLENEKIDAIYSSDLARAKNTAKEIAKMHSEAKLKFVKLLRELYAGKYRGTKGSAMDWNNRPKEVESRKSMRERAKKILEKAYKEFPKGTVVFVGHAGINLALTSVVLGKTERYMAKTKIQKNTGILVFEDVERKLFI